MKAAYKYYFLSRSRSRFISGLRMRYTNYNWT